MPIFAGLRNVPLAATDVVIVWTTIIWCVIAFWLEYERVAIAQMPYFALRIDCDGDLIVDLDDELGQSMNSTCDVVWPSLI